MKLIFVMKNGSQNEKGFLIKKSFLDLGDVQAFITDANIRTNANARWGSPGAGKFIVVLDHGLVKAHSPKS